MTFLLFFSLVAAASIRQVDMASKAAFTASRALFESPADTALKLRGVTSKLFCMVGSPLAACNKVSLSHARRNMANCLRPESSTILKVGRGRDSAVRCILVHGVR